MVYDSVPYVGIVRGKMAAAYNMYKIIPSELALDVVTSFDEPNQSLSGVTSATILLVLLNGFCNFFCKVFFLVGL